MDKKTLKSIFESSYKNPKEAQSQLEEKGFKYDTELSTPKSKVFVDPQGNPHIAYRGTELNKGLKTAIEDIGTDFYVGLGKTTQLEKEAKKLREQVEQKYSKPVTAYGTSLGGKIAESSGAQKVVTYNRAYGLRDVFKTTPSNQTNYRNPMDIISLPSKLNKGKKSISIGKVTGNPLLAHSTKSI